MNNSSTNPPASASPICDIPDYAREVKARLPEMGWNYISSTTADDWR